MHPTHLTHLELLRRAESNLALTLLRSVAAPPARLIEIGGGAGWQSQEFAAAGYQVFSYDLPNTKYAEHRIYPVQDYDGHKLPEADRSADIVFSSNVLEHIPHVYEFQSELLRVLKPEGVAVHILPSAAWRFWTTATHYPDVVAKVARRLGSSWRPSSEQAALTASHPSTVSAPATGGDLARALRNNIRPERHGEFGSATTELYYFSRYRWQRLFETTGWRVVHYETNQLSYTGNGLLGLSLGLDTRRRLSRTLGSSCHIFLLKNSTAKQFQ